ncbi:MAG TPA: cobyrinate a,c-diamide synthase [Thermodesulfobacteriota bacterium]|nr:cobyrinate a,c-diamide synthase [Thermodesulfobacteriota bacterium]
MAGFLSRLVMAALRGGAGKTTLSLGMIAAWKRLGRNVAAFKKGPDFIDSAWLSLAAQRPCRNLDTFLLGPKKVQQSFGRNAESRGISLIEGNRGLYDGMDSRGTQSTAELAKLLKAPVVLVLDCAKVTRTLAAMVLGCQRMDPEVDIRGVILNQVARSRHEKILRASIEETCGLPVLGAVPRMDDFPFPERHLGLIPPQEHQWVSRALERAAEVAEKYLDLEPLWKIAETAPPFCWKPEEKRPILKAAGNQPEIGIMKDSAFQFYYPENLQALADRGARLIEISAVREKTLPSLDALYIGGGFPETHAEQLADNLSFRQSLREAIENGLPVYAECGGLMYLGESLAMDTRIFPMAGVLPVSFSMEKRPQGHGYTLLEVERENPFYAVGRVLKGHEFHYSRVRSLEEGRIHFAFRVKRGTGIKENQDGLWYKNVLATYSHVHALGCEEWADGLIRKAMESRSGYSMAAV